MGTDFLTNIDWSNPTTIGIGITIIAVIVIGDYLWWAWLEKSGRLPNKGDAGSAQLTDLSLQGWSVLSNLKINNTKILC